MSKTPVEIIKRYSAGAEKPRRHMMQDYTLMVHMEPNETIEVAVTFDKPFATARWLFVPQFVETQINSLAYSIQFRARDQCKLAISSPFKAATEVALIMFFIGEDSDSE
jgi:hypothetical protein